MIGHPRDEHTDLLVELIIYVTNELYRYFTQKLASTITPVVTLVVILQKKTDKQTYSFFFGIINFPHYAERDRLTLLPNLWQ